MDQSKSTDEREFYRREIIKMVERIENPNYLFKIYHYILAKYRRKNTKEAEV